MSEGEDRLCASCWNSLTPVRSTDHTFTVMTDRFRSAGIIDTFVPLYYFEKHHALQSLAHSLKYGEITAFGTELGKKLGRKLKEEKISADAVMPVPLNKRKERERGYNQSSFIARGVAEELSVPVFSNIVSRKKYTVTQTRLTADERKENLADAFAVHQRRAAQLHRATIIIVDDIITTGSTIQEMGKLLKEHGVRTVIAASAGLAKLGEDI